MHFKVKAPSFALVAIVAALVVPAASAQELVLQATAAAPPIVETTVNGQPVRLEVDPRAPDIVVLNPDAATRLKLFDIPLVQVAISVEGGTIAGKAARPNIRYANGKTTRANTLHFKQPVTDAADGIIGPGSLPWDAVTLVLDPEAETDKLHVFALKDPDHWFFKTLIAPGQEAEVRLDVRRNGALLNRSLTNALQGVVRPAGALAETPLILGLSTRTQPVETDAAIALDGMPLKSILARTSAPIASPGDNVVVVVGGKPEPPGVIVGRETLAGCRSARVDRKARTLTLACAS